mmetsp:Transcript_11336/g.32565  ORF Transcript_11336/g.32565 Transcript_11336/m.32565 type:complete len:256 (-) Transcript_11336:743-1510(-)
MVGMRSVLPFPSVDVNGVMIWTKTPVSIQRNSVILRYSDACRPPSSACRSKIMVILMKSGMVLFQIVVSGPDKKGPTAERAALMEMLATATSATVSANEMPLVRNLLKEDADKSSHLTASGSGGSVTLKTRSRKIVPGASAPVLFMPTLTLPVVKADSAARCPSSVSKVMYTSAASYLSFCKSLISSVKVVILSTRTSGSRNMLKIRRMGKTQHSNSLPMQPTSSSFFSRKYKSIATRMALSSSRLTPFGKMTRS